MPRRQASAFSGRALTTTTRRAPAPVAPADARAGAGADRSRRVRRSRLALFGFVLACYLSAPNITNTDAYLAVPTAVSIVHSANLTLDEFHDPLVREPQGFVTARGHGATALVEANTMGPPQLATASLITALAVIVLPGVVVVDILGHLGVVPSAKTAPAATLARRRWYRPWPTSASAAPPRSAGGRCGPSTLWRPAASSPSSWSCRPRTRDGGGPRLRPHLRPRGIRMSMRRHSSFTTPRERA